MLSITQQQGIVNLANELLVNNSLAFHFIFLFASMCGKLLFYIALLFYTIG